MENIRNEVNLKGLNEIYEQYSNCIYRFLLISCKSSEKAKEYVSEVFRMNLRNNSHISDRYETTLRLFNCAYRTVASKIKTMGMIDFDEVPDINFAGIENRDMMMDFFSRGLRERQIIYLYNVEQMEINEISNILEMLAYDVKNILISGDSEMGGTDYERQ